MHKIKGRLTNVVENGAKEGKKPFKILQVLSPESGFLHQIDGEIITVTKRTMDGRDCQAIRMLSNGGKFMTTEKLIDFDMSRTWKPGKCVVHALPLVKISQGKPVIIYELHEDQKEPVQVLDGDVFLKGIKDWQLRDWKLGNVTLSVRVESYFNNETGSRGLNYTIENSQE